MFSSPGPRVGEVQLAGVPRVGGVNKVGVVEELLTETLPLLLGMQK